MCRQQRQWEDCQCSDNQVPRWQGSESETVGIWSLLLEGTCSDSQVYRHYALQPSSQCQWHHHGTAIYLYLLLSIFTIAGWGTSCLSCFSIESWSQVWECPWNFRVQTYGFEVEGTGFLGDSAERQNGEVTLGLIGFRGMVLWCLSMNKMGMDTLVETDTLKVKTHASIRSVRFWDAVDKMYKLGHKELMGSQRENPLCVGVFCADDRRPEDSSWP